MRVRALFGAVAVAGATLSPAASFASPSTGSCLDGQVAATEPYRATSNFGKAAVEDRLPGRRGVEVFVPAAPSLSAQWLHVLVGREAQASTDPTCPLSVDGLRYSVSSDGPGYRVQLTGDDRGAAQEIERRAEARWGR